MHDQCKALSFVSKLERNDIEENELTLLSTTTFGNEQESTNSFLELFGLR